MMKIKIVLECCNDGMNDTKNTINKFTINSKGLVQYSIVLALVLVLGPFTHLTFHPITMLQYSTLHTHIHYT